MNWAGSGHRTLASSGGQLHFVQAGRGSLRYTVPLPASGNLQEDRAVRFARITNFPADSSGEQTAWVGAVARANWTPRLRLEGFR